MLNSIYDRIHKSNYIYSVEGSTESILASIYIFRASSYMTGKNFYIKLVKFFDLHFFGEAAISVESAQALFYGKDARASCLALSSATENGG